MAHENGSDGRIGIPAGAVVRLGVALLVVLALGMVAVTPAAADDCDDSEEDCDSGSSGFSFIESFLSEWGNTMTAITEGWASGGSTCSNTCPQEA